MIETSLVCSSFLGEGERRVGEGGFGEGGLVASVDVVGASFTGVVEEGRAGGGVMTSDSSFKAK